MTMAEAIEKQLQVYSFADSEIGKLRRKILARVMTRNGHAIEEFTEIIGGSMQTTLQCLAVSRPKSSGTAATVKNRIVL